MGSRNKVNPAQNALDGALDEKISLHLEERLMLYMEALIANGRCTSMNSRIRALLAADYAYGDDEEWNAMVAEGIRAYERRFQAKL